jgi:hypothetical protein
MVGETWVWVPPVPSGGIEDLRNLYKEEGEE